MDPASKLKALRRAAPFNPEKKMTATEHYDALKKQEPRTLATKAKDGLDVGINAPWRPPPSTPLLNSLGAPGKRSPVVARNTTAPDTAPAARLSFEEAREKLEAAREKLERQLDQFERLVRERREAAAAAAAAAGAPPPAPPPELTEAERKEDFTRVGWTRVRASWCTSTRVVEDLTHFKATPLVRRALWQALLKDVLAASRMPPARMYGALYVLYLALGAMRGTFVRVLRNRHAPFKKPKDARIAIAVIMEDDLEEAAERAEAYAQARARALAQAAASPDAPPAASTEASPTMSSAVSSPPPAAASPSTSPAASPVLPSAAPPALPSAASPSQSSAESPIQSSAESSIQPSAESPSLPRPVSPTASSAPSAAASPALPSAAPTVLPSAESPIQSPAESSIQSSEGPSVPPPVSPTALPAALRAVLPPTLLCKPTVDRPAPPPPIPPFERKPFKPVNELKRACADDNEDDHPAKRRGTSVVCQERATLGPQRANSRIPIGRHVQSRNHSKPTPGSRATSGSKGAKLAPTSNEGRM